MSNRENLVGLKYKMLTVMEYSHKVGRKAYWKCICECGKEKTARGDCLKSGSVTSCGCLKKEQDRINLKKRHKHLESKTRLYYIWQHMLTRCRSEKDKSYDNYGGRGISVCEEWSNDFYNFRKWALNNGYQEQLSIDRIDNYGNYSPENCRWITNIDQCNNRRKSIIINYNNKTQSIAEWCRELDLNYGTVFNRYKRGWSIEKIFEPTESKYRGTRGNRSQP